MDKLENQQCPVCGENKLTLTEDEMEIPYFGKVYLLSMNCGSCGFSRSEVEAAEKKEPCKITFTVENEDDLKARVVKSSEATVKIPQLKMSMEPGENSIGFITNVEGLINRFEKIIEHEKEASDDEEIKNRAKKLLKKIRRVKWGSDKLKIIIEDPSGNSAIISEKAEVKRLR